LTQSAIDLPPIKLIQQKPFFHRADLVDSVPHSGDVTLVNTINDLVQQFSSFPRSSITTFLEGDRAAAVLWRCRPASTDAHRIEWRLFEWDEPLDPHLVLPPVGEVVFVEKAFIHTKVKIGQTDVPGVLRVPGPTKARDTELLAVDPKAMKMIVGPGEGDLDDIMEVRQGIVGADHQSPPDRRINAPDPHMNPVSSRIRLSCHGCQLSNLRRATESVSAPVLSWSPLVQCPFSSKGKRVTNVTRLFRRCTARYLYVTLLKEVKKKMSLRDRLQEIDRHKHDEQHTRAAILAQWLNDIDRLYEFVKTQLSELLPEEKENIRKIAPTKVTRSEELLGDYETHELNVPLRGRTIVFSPVARIVFGSSGRVDMFLRGHIDEPYKLLHDQTVTPAVWRIVKGTRTEALPSLDALTKETLEKALEELLR
jgi:hypothetical protein